LDIKAPNPNVAWDDLAFSLTKTDFMYITTKTKEQKEFSLGKIVPYGPIPLEPAATVLNYGQGSFEGLKGK
jgi:branched-chain amino acid aminotransferase